MRFSYFSREIETIGGDFKGNAKSRERIISLLTILYSWKQEKWDKSYNFAKGKLGRFDKKV